MQPREDHDAPGGPVVVADARWPGEGGALTDPVSVATYLRIRDGLIGGIFRFETSEEALPYAGTSRS